MNLDLFQELQTLILKLLYYLLHRIQSIYVMPTRRYNTLPTYRLNNLTVYCEINRVVQVSYVL
jgi:hypothetical protein